MDFKCKVHQLILLEKFIEHSLMFSFTIFEILLFEARSVLRPAKQVIGTKGLIWSVLLRYQMPRHYNIANWLPIVSLTEASNGTSLQNRKLVSLFYVTMRRPKVSQIGPSHSRTSSAWSASF